jgi:hypothetical protein
MFNKGFEGMWGTCGCYNLFIELTGMATYDVNLGTVWSWDKAKLENVG